jgi:hypothetical protein
VHGLDGGDHHAAERRSRSGRRGSECEQQTTAGLGCSGRKRVSPTWAKPHRLEALGSSFHPAAAEPAEELLCAVAEEEQADRDARYQAEYTDGRVFLLGGA